MKALELEPYSIAESERAAGQGSFKLPKKRKMETQQTLTEAATKIQKLDKDGDVKMD